MQISEGENYLHKHHRAHCEAMALCWSAVGGGGGAGGVADGSRVKCRQSSASAARPIGNCSE